MAIESFKCLFFNRLSRPRILKSYGLKHKMGSIPLSGLQRDLTAIQWGLLYVSYDALLQLLSKGVALKSRQLVFYVREIYACETRLHIIKLEQQVIQLLRQSAPGQRLIYPKLHT